MSRKLNALVEYYGGKVVNLKHNDLVQNQNNITHAFSVGYDDVTRKLDLAYCNRVKFVTPDWLLDCINESKLQDETIYHPKYLKTNPDNQSLIESMESKETNNSSDQVATEMDVATEVEQPKPAVASSHKISLFLTHHHHHHHHQNHHQKSPVKSDDRNEAKAVSDAATTEQDQVSVTTPLFVSPSQTTKSSNSDGGQQVTPTRQYKKRTVRKQSTSLANNDDENNRTTVTTAPGGDTVAASQQSSTFTLDMNEIFQTVIGTANQSSSSNGNHEKESSGSTTELKSKSNEEISRNPLPICLELIQAGSSSSGVQAETNEANKAIADDDNESTDASTDANHTTLVHDLVQENSHLIKFDCCLLGCVFYLKANETIYPGEFFPEWTNVIERFGGKVVDNYEAFRAQITHVICPDRFSDIYKKALGDNKRLVTIYWLEDVLQEQKMRQPWQAYHFPSPYDFKNGPLKKHVSCC
jgi:hypothetical protein